jgi:hypothetical protein
MIEKAKELKQLIIGKSHDNRRLNLARSFGF